MRHVRALACGRRVTMSLTSSALRACEGEENKRRVACREDSTHLIRAMGMCGLLLKQNGSLFKQL